MDPLRALFLLAFTVSAVTPAADELRLIWNLSPQPFHDYADCRKESGVDFCLPSGVWYGNRLQKCGPIRVSAKGEVQVDAACNQASFLLHESVFAARVLNPEKRAAMDPGCEVAEPAGSLLAARLGKKTHVVRLGKESTTLRLWISEKTPIEVCAHAADFMRGGKVYRFAKSPDLATESWRGSIVGDLNEDGNLELILYAKLRGFRESMAMLVSLTAPSEVWASTVTRPNLFLKSPERKLIYDLQQARDACEHWGGEEPTDPHRAKEIAHGVERDCADYRKRLEAALKAFPGNSELKKFPRVD